jgi:hypothetical protein
MIVKQADSEMQDQESSYANSLGSAQLSQRALAMLHQPGSTALLDIQVSTP